MSSEKSPKKTSSSPSGQSNRPKGTGRASPALSSSSSSSAKKPSSSKPRSSSPSRGGKRTSSSSTKSRKGKKKNKGKKGGGPLFQFEIKWWMGVVAVLVIVLAIAVPFLLLHSDGTGVEVPRGNYSYGIDISHHNREGIVWDSLVVMTDRRGLTTRSKEDAISITPLSFVFIKATEGEKMVDKAFQENWKDAGRQKYLSRGAYHFYRTNKDPLKQARNFCSTVGSLRYRDLPPVLDIETINGPCTRKELNDALSIWLRSVEEHFGRTPVIYTGESFAKTHIEDSLLRKYPLWIAHYGVPSPKRDDWRWWQFTDKGTVYGVPGPVDMNVMKNN